MDDLERRVEEALAIARSSEAAAISIGAAALEAAGQARRAAELAERASAAVLAAPQPPRPGPSAVKGRTRPLKEGAIEDFNVRADRLAERLRRLQGLPPSA
jgi:hypothetical protein